MICKAIWVCWHTHETHNWFFLFHCHCYRYYYHYNHNFTNTQSCMVYWLVATVDQWCIVTTLFMIGCGCWAWYTARSQKTTHRLPTWCGRCCRLQQQFTNTEYFIFYVYRVDTLVIHQLSWSWDPIFSLLLSLLKYWLLEFF